MSTKVKFYKGNGEVFAYFPEISADNNGNMTCYAHIGQHSACSKGYVKGKRIAIYSEYFDLLRELIGQGYKDLNIMNLDYQDTECHRPPTKGEIKFGEGATHYRTFLFSEIGINKKGELKKWFISSDDKLRYYRD